ncbi:MAG: Efflux pump periplasmic linker BepF [Lentisphaerae bacterium ADurb.Bin242]|nr:MAG: Efflux pump periplasmic linker BepF [Lentisphaerae bacterium ADurb.Bin242]
MFPTLLRKFFSLVFLSGIVFWAGCREEVRKEVRLPAVVAEPAAEMEFADSITEIGEVAAYDAVDLVANVSGFLTEANFQEGSVVKKGTKLFQIDPAVYRAAVAKAEADLNKAQAEDKNSQIEYNRQKQLVEKDATARRNFDNAEMKRRTAEAEVKSAEAVLAQKKVDLGYTEILAPFDGYIGFKRYSVGNMVGPSGGTLARITRSGNVKIYFSVDELNLLKLLRAYPQIERESGNHSPGKSSSKKGPSISVYFQDGVKYNRNAWLNAWSNEVKDGNFRLQAVCEDPEDLLLPGMYVKVQVQTNFPGKALVIREESIMREQLGDFVYVVNKDNKIERRKIQLGGHAGEWYVVTSGLKAGELVVTSGLQKVGSGDRVQVVTAKDAVPGSSPAENEKAPASGGKNAPASQAPSEQKPKK